MALFGAASPAAPDPPLDVAFLHVRVLPMDAERAIEDATVVIRGDRIVAVGPAGSVAVPAGATRIDGAGATLMPGLADLHVHLYSEEDLLNYLAHGVTTVLDMNGSADTRAWRARVASGDIAGPTVYTAGPSLNGQPPGNPTFVALDDPGRAAFEVRRQKALGYDVIKVYSTLAPEVYHAVLETAAEEEMTVVGHLPLQVGFEGALDAGQAMIGHGEELWKLLRNADSTGLEAATRRIVESGARVTPNLSALDRILDEAADLPALLEHPEAAFVSPAAYSEWLPSNNRYWGADTARFLPGMRREVEFVTAMTARLQRAGVPLLLGTDSPVFGFAGAAAHRELELMVAAGLTPYEALSAATREAGAFLADAGAADPFGQVAAGHRADLILVDGDPLADVAAASRIRGVMARGVWRTAEEIAALRAERAVRYRDLHAAVRAIDSLMDSGEVEQAARRYEETRAGSGDTELLAETVLRTEGRALLRREGWADRALRLFELTAGAYPTSHAAWADLSDTRAALGDTAGALSALVRARELVPSDAGLLDRQARLESGSRPPSFVVAGVWRLATRARVEGTIRDVELVVTLEPAGPDWTGTIVTDTPLPELTVESVMAGGDRLWISAPFESSSLQLRLIVEGDTVRGWWNLGYSEQGTIRGRRTPP